MNSSTILQTWHLFWFPALLVRKVASAYECGWRQALIRFLSFFSLSTAAVQTHTICSSTELIQFFMAAVSSGSLTEGFLVKLSKVLVSNQERTSRPMKPGDPRTREFKDGLSSWALWPGMHSVHSYLQVSSSFFYFPLLLRLKGPSSSKHALPLEVLPFVLLIVASWRPNGTEKRRVCFIWWWLLYSTYNFHYCTILKTFDRLGWQKVTYSNLTGERHEDSYRQQLNGVVYTTVINLIFLEDQKKNVPKILFFFSEVYMYNLCIFISSHTLKYIIHVRQMGKFHAKMCL